jgi:PhnB protein
MQWNPYLAFNGNCKEAFEFYEKVLGGKIIAMMGYADMPGAQDLPPGMIGRIMHARLVLADQVLMGCDAHPDIRYDGIRGCDIAVQVKTAEEAERLFVALSEGGTVTMPIGETFWTVRFGMLTDRFGVAWMINCEKPAGGVTVGGAECL